MARIILLIFILGCNTPPPESELVSDASRIVDELPTSPEKKIIKSTLNMCGKTIVEQDREIRELRKSVQNLSEELSDTKQKAGQVDFINKILWVAFAIFIGYLVMQFLPLLKKFI